MPTNGSRCSFRITSFATTRRGNAKKKKNEGRQNMAFGR